MMNAVLVTVAFLLQIEAAMGSKICEGSSCSLIVYYRPNCPTTTSHAHLQQTIAAH
ncbi:hypothetical protein ACCAA_130132 [Candidatus Accumulibacter aalborgensis]|uniref:Uncharacterized protein n=1 Tax=Candidatus Accumulibacter aalborgensis TaxID=1860102 RepID=A0A1A8XIH8_9PROT|nr:hypothetical protein ACCAA_130132 [Candidatus Accumulibacter aalborgensis]